MVIIDASQALDPGSIPGRRMAIILFLFERMFFFAKNRPSLAPLAKDSGYVRPCSSVGRASD